MTITELLAECDLLLVELALLLALLEQQGHKEAAEHWLQARFGISLARAN
jgi:hypothetical protein